MAALLALGATCTEIARARGRSLKTVDCQRLSILRKLELRSTTALARWALRAGLVTLDDGTYERGISDALPVEVSQIVRENGRRVAMAIVIAGPPRPPPEDES